MTPTNYTKKLDDLRNKVSLYAKLPNKQTTGIISNKSSINTKTICFYSIPPVIIFIILLISKPSFITNEHINEDNVSTKKINFKYLIASTLISGIIVDIGIFFYIRKRSQ